MAEQQRSALNTVRRGSCLCGAVTFEIVGSIAGVGSCHCSKCRKVSGTGGNAQFIVRTERFKWLEGRDEVSTFKLSSGWGTSRCGTCGSPVPATYDGGRRMWVPAGLMDDALDTSIVQHIFCGSQADWDRESPDVKRHAEHPP
jgi:hypothetical protein